jgi:Leucine-rich repeat (LRR) protein
VNQISDISPLANLTSLEHIELYNNSISDISALSNLTNLNWLWIHANQISDISPLVANAGLSGGDWVTVCYNPLSADSLNIYIPELQGRGVYISCPRDEEGGCFIATAAYGTSTAEELNTLRAFRDEVLLENSLGSQLVAFYYEVSPPVADFISEHESLRTLVRELLVDPVARLVEATEAIWGNRVASH